jgi:hypothetical protein
MTRGWEGLYGRPCSLDHIEEQGQTHNPAGDHKGRPYGILGLRLRCNAYSLSLPLTDSSTRLMILLRMSMTWFSVRGFSRLS